MFASTKRPKEDDFLVHQSIPEKKKHRPLPLQTHALQNPPCSENSSFALHFSPPALTPVESDDDDGPDSKRLCNTHPFLAAESSMDLDAGKNPHVLSHAELPLWTGNMHSNGYVQPSPIPHTLVNQSLNITSPTWRNLPANMHPSSSSDMEVVPVQHMDSASSNLETERSHDAWWDRRRLPSPISEDGESSTKSRKSSSEGSMLSFPAMDQMSDIADSRSAKKKVSFSMGYRADCEKCRQKVPGHYSHILRA